jgi:hypothetical protein
MSEEQMRYDFHARTCRCDECREKEMKRDCDTCSRPPTPAGVCPLSKMDVDTCLGIKSRPYWRPRSQGGLFPEEQGGCETAAQIFGGEATEPYFQPCTIIETCNQIHDPDAPIKGMDEFLREVWAKEQKQEPANKFDSGKPRYDLLPPDVMEEITLIFTMGAEKYKARNWEQGMSWGRVFGAAMRHMWAFWSGKTTDPESGRPHLAHAIVNLMFLLAYYIRGAGTDDRYE